MSAAEEQDQIVARIALLEKYLDAMWQVFHSSSAPDPERSRTFVLRNMVAVRQAVREAGVAITATVEPPRALGGLVQNVDLFANILNPIHGSSTIPDAANCVEAAIGVYEHLRDKTGLVRIASREAIDIEGAIERALRPTFRSRPPGSEKDVQDAIETILNSLGVPFTREQEVAPVGSRAFTPDFALTPLDLALEVKFANEKHSASDIQDELAADIAAYRTKWKRLLVVVYDCGAIADPERMRADNMKHFGVSVLIVKH